MDRIDAKYALLRIVCIVCCVAVILAVGGISVRDIFDAKDILTVCMGGLILSLPVCADIRKKEEWGVKLCSVLPRNMFIAGTVTGIMFILAAVSRPALTAENAGEAMQESGLLSSLYAFMILKSRPFFYGCLLYLFCGIIFSRTDKRSFSVPPVSDGFQAELLPEKQAKFAVLSCREKEVARRAGAGASNAQIAEELYISIPTVKRHLANIFEKTGIKSRHELSGISFD